MASSGDILRGGVARSSWCSTKILLLAAILWTYQLEVCSGSVSCDFLVGSFNVQVLGVTKVGKGHVLDILVSIIRRYDALLVQELRDSQGTAFATLAAAVNSSSATPYDYVITPRLGRTSSKEQYIIFYRSDKLRIPNWYVYNDTAADVFEREPIIAQIEGIGSYNCFSQLFSIIGVHVRPDSVASELNALVDVYNQSVSQLNNPNSILTGDFNADCSYLSNTAANSVSLFTDTRFVSLINKSADTTVSASSCAYDRILVAGSYAQSLVVPGSVSVYRYDTALGLNMTIALEVSDHYPVELVLRGSPVVATTTVPTTSPPTTVPTTSSPAVAATTSSATRCCSSALPYLTLAGLYALIVTLA